MIHGINPKGPAVADGVPQRNFMAISREVQAHAWSSDFVRKVLETYVTQIGVLGLGIFTSVVAARILGPTGLGQYTVAAAIGAVGVQFGNMGLNTSNTYAVARNPELLPALLANSLLASCLIGGAGATLAGFFFALRPALAPVNGPLVVLSLVWIPVGLAQYLTQGLLVGVQETRAYNRIELTKKVLALLLIGLLIVRQNITPETVFMAGLIALVTSLILSLSRLWRILPKRPTPSLSLFKWNFGMGAKAYLAVFFAFLVLRLDLVMVKYMLGAEQAGYYSIAATFADYVLLLPAAVASPPPVNELTELGFDSVRVYINDALHLDFRRSTYRGMQTWLWAANYKIEIYLAGATIPLEYTDEGLWREVRDGLAALPLNGE